MIRGYPNWNLKASDRVDVAFRSFDWEKDILSLQKVFPEINYMSPVMSRNNAGATAGGLQIDEIAIMGVTPEFIGITNRMIDSGRDISPFHVESRSPVCVIGSDIAQRLFRDINPLGRF